MSDAYRRGVERANADYFKLRKRVFSATTQDINSRWWRFRHYAYATWLGSIAPPLWTKAGRAYNERMNRYYTEGEKP